MGRREFEDLRNQVGNDGLNSARRVGDFTAQVPGKHLLCDAMNHRDSAHGGGPARDQDLDRFQNGFRIDNRSNRASGL